MSYTGRVITGASFFGPGKGKCMCGRPLRTVYTLSRLTFLSDPDECFWRRERLDLKPVQSRMLAMLIIAGRVSTADLYQLLERRWAASTRVSNHISAIRIALRRVGATAEIDRIKGWGYRLMMEK